MTLELTWISSTLSVLSLIIYIIHLCLWCCIIGTLYILAPVFMSTIIRNIWINIDIIFLISIHPTVILWLFKRFDDFNFFGLSFFVYFFFFFLSHKWNEHSIQSMSVYISVNIIITTVIREKNQWATEFIANRINFSIFWCCCWILVLLWGFFFCMFCFMFVS